MNTKEWAEKLNNMEYRSDSLLENDKQLKEDGVVAVVGASDDLCELYGAIHDEYVCYNGTILYWNGKDFLQKHKRMIFWDMLITNTQNFLKCVKSYSKMMLCILKFLMAVIVNLNMKPIFLVNGLM